MLGAAGCALEPWALPGACICIAVRIAVRISTSIGIRIGISISIAISIARSFSPLPGGGGLQCTTKGSGRATAYALSSKQQFLIRVLYCEVNECLGPPVARLSLGRCQAHAYALILAMLFALALALGFALAIALALRSALPGRSAASPGVGL